MRTSSASRVKSGSELPTLCMRGSYNGCRRGWHKGGTDIECVWCGNTDQFNGNLLVCGKGKAPSFTPTSNQTSSCLGYPNSPSVTWSALEVRLLYDVTERSASGNCHGDRTQFLPLTALLCPNKSENRTLHVIRVLWNYTWSQLSTKTTTKQPETWGIRWGNWICSSVTNEGDKYDIISVKALTS